MHTEAEPGCEKKAQRSGGFVPWSRRIEGYPDRLLITDRHDWLRLIPLLCGILVEKINEMFSDKVFLLVYGEDMIAIFQKSQLLLLGSDLVVDKVGIPRTGDVIFTRLEDHRRCGYLP